MLTNFQLEELAKKMNIDLVFVGFKDELPRKIQVNKAYIVNMQNSYDEDGLRNVGSHWVAFQVQKLKNDKIQPLYFDSYGKEPPEEILKSIKTNFKIHIPHTTKDIQSLMGEICGYFALSWLFFINNYENKTGDIYQDTENYLSLFDDLTTSIDFKRNEYYLKMFFQPKDKNLRKEIDVIQNSNIITDGRTDKLNVDIKII